MSWKWEELTARDFPQAVAKASYTCLLPLGVLEKHGEHLPLGTDLLNVEALAERAAAIEPVVVFPRYFFTQIQEARHWPGTIAVSHDTLFRLLDEVCGEIARNGFRKIVLLNGHGGNESFLSYFCMYLLQRPRGHSTYFIGLSDYTARIRQDPEWKRMMVSAFDHHGGEGETSLTMAVRPDLVRLEYATDEAVSLDRLNHLPPQGSPMWWYARYPDHYAGDARPATADKGRYLLDHFVSEVARLLKAIKEDTVAPALEKEFFSRVEH